MDFMYFGSVGKEIRKEYLNLMFGDEAREMGLLPVVPLKKDGMLVQVLTRPRVLSARLKPFYPNGLRTHD